MERVIADASQVPLAPSVDWPWLERVRALRAFNSGPARLRDAAGPVVMLYVGPKAFTPVFAAVTSPQGARDVLAGADGAFEKEMIVHREFRQWLGLNVFSLTHEPWIPRRRALQPVFTKQNVRHFAGQMVTSASMRPSWASRSRTSCTSSRVARWRPPALRTGCPRRRAGDSDGRMPSHFASSTMPSMPLSTIRLARRPSSARCSRPPIRRPGGS